MDIWVYQENSPFKLREPEVKIWRENYQGGSDAMKTLSEVSCIYCASPMVLLDSRPTTSADTRVILHVCNDCGWWVITEIGGYHWGPEGAYWVSRSAGVLKKLNLSDISIPTGELRRYLVANFDNRFYVHPKKYEDVVAGVFADFGYRVRTTSYTGDKGIDIFILDGEGNDTVGIQVKRYKKKIEAEQIRSLAGAMVLNGVTQGMFVTTSCYRSGAIQTAEDYILRGLDISLVDADDFYDKLELTRRPIYSSAEDQEAAFYDFWKGHRDIPHIHSVSW
jgi:restriction system protein